MSVNCSRISGLQDLAGLSAYGLYRDRLKNILLGPDIHYKPIRGVFQLRTPYRYRLHKPFKPPGEQLLWRNQTSCLNGLGLYAGFMWLTSIINFKGSRRDGLSKIPIYAIIVLLQ